jgi:hypothetical protein
VANAVLYTTVANVAAIPGSPANNAAVEVTNSTGIQSFTPLSGLPAGFIGSSGLSVRIIYQTSGATWTWIQYFPNDPETRYLKLAGGTLTGALTLSGAPSSGLQATTKTYVDTADATLTTAAAAAQTTANAAVVRSGDTMTGALGATAGTAGAPSLYFTGDTNTGIYSPGADQVAISTGGSGRVFVDSSGRVGLGTSSPGYQLDLGGGTTVSTRIRIARGSDDTNEMRIGYETIDLYRNVALASPQTGLTIRQVGSDGTRNVLAIDGSGRVGIGNSSPGSYNASSDDLVVGDHVGAHGVTICSQNNSAGYIMFADGTTGAQTYAGQITYDHTNNRLTLGTNDGTTGLTVDSSQRVGIGDTGPDATLVTKGAGISDVAFAIKHAWGSSSTALMTASNSSGEVMRLQRDGKLLIGTSSAVIASSNRLIQLSSSDGSFYVAHNSTNNSAAGAYLGGINFSGVGNGSAAISATIEALTDAQWGAGDFPSRLVFSTTADGAASPTERFRIGSAGQLGIGGATYGTSGQVLTSGGASAAPTWSAVSGGITSGTAVASTSGTSIDFTGLPSGVKRIVVMLNGVSTNGTSIYQIQLGTSGGIQSTSYTGCYTYTGLSSSGGALTTGFGIFNDGPTNFKSGSLIFNFVSANIWTCQGVCAQTGGAPGYTMQTAGTVSLSGTLDRIRITTVNGTDTFDAGSINIMYQS